MADALVIPGRMNGPGVPLLAYTGDVVAARGGRVHRHTWTAPPPDPTVDTSRRAAWVREQVSPLPAGTGLLIGKSLGSLAAPLAAERSLPAIWLTPLLHEPWAVDALERATAPFLLVGGTADDAWDGAVARRLTPYVLEVDDADHVLSVPGPVRDSIAVLFRVVDAAENFLDAISGRAPSR